jgi:tetratricopeptide (TPR) repeat protein
MWCRLAVAFLLGLGVLPIKAERLKGRIVENEIGGHGLPNVQIADDAGITSPATSDDSGRFSLDFPTKKPGDPVHIAVKSKAYAVVNWEFLDQRLPPAERVDDTGVTIVVCQTKDLNECRRRYYQLTAEAVSKIASQSKEQVTTDCNPQTIDFQRYIKEWAAEYGLPAEQAQAQVEKWAAEVQEQRDNTSDLALAEFYQKHFSKAAQLSEQAAQDKIGELGNLERKQEEMHQGEQQLKVGIVSDLRRAGDAHYNDCDFIEALASYQGALQYTKREDNPQLWAAALVDLGISSWELAMRGGYGTNEFLAQAVSAFRKALEVRTREQRPQDWAKTQNCLGNALLEQGIRTRGAPGSELLAQAMGAYRSALEVYTREQRPQDWAKAEYNLGVALLEQGIRTGGAQASELLAQAVDAYRSALEVYTPFETSPAYYRTVQENLAKVEAMLRQAKDAN